MPNCASKDIKLFLDNICPRSVYLSILLFSLSGSKRWTERMIRVEFYRRNESQTIKNYRSTTSVMIKDPEIYSLHRSYISHELRPGAGKDHTHYTS